MRFFAIFLRFHKAAPSFHKWLNEVGNQCLVLFELEGNILDRKESHRVELSVDGWMLEYFTKIAKNQIDAATMLGMMPDTNNIHQAAISKALNKWQLHCNDKVVNKEGEKFKKVHSIQLPFQACNHFYDIHGNQVEEISFVWDKTKPGHTIALVGL